VINLTLWDRCTCGHLRLRHLWHEARVDWCEQCACRRFDLAEPARVEDLPPDARRKYREQTDIVAAGKHGRWVRHVAPAIEGAESYTWWGTGHVSWREETGRVGRGDWMKDPEAGRVTREDVQHLLEIMDAVAARKGGS
jgi:hypothetical protein